MESLRRAVAVFDPAHPRFVARMARCAGVVALVAVCGTCAVAARFATLPFGRYMSGVLLLEIGQDERAAGVAEALIRDYPTSNAAYYKLAASAHRRAGRIDDQLRVLADGTAAMPGSWYAHTELCWYGALFDRAAEHMDACEIAVELAPPGEGYGLLVRGFARARIGDRAGAAADIEAGLARRTAGRRSPWHLRDPWDQWLVELAAGSDPFTPDVLARMRARF